MSSTHALRDKWFVSFLPLLVPDVVASHFKGDWNLAAQKHMQRLDWLTSVEELWSTVNSLPKIQQLGVGSTYIFSRNDKDPSFETFPNGARVVVSLFRAPATEVGIETILASVLGESISQESTDNKAVCDVIRISARPSREHNDTLRVEVWLNDQSYSSAVTAALKKALQRRDIGPTLFSITDSPFDSAKSPVSTTHAAKAAASPTPPAKAGEATEEADRPVTGASSTHTKADEASQKPASTAADVENAKASESPCEEGTSQRKDSSEEATGQPSDDTATEDTGADHSTAEGTVADKPVAEEGVSVTVEGKSSKEGNSEDATVVEVT